jgi:preprotein translocase subunit SecD
VSELEPPPVVPPGAPPSRSGPTHASRLWVMLLVAIVILGYLLMAFLTKGIWTGRDGTRATFALEAQEGSPPPPDVTKQALDDITARLAERGVSDAEIAVKGGDVVATFPGRDLDNGALRSMFGPGVPPTLNIRPLILATPVEAQTPPPGTPLPPEPGGSPGQIIAGEKALRQATTEAPQVRAMQWQSTRCDENDALAGQDDPHLPLVTCSTDGQDVFLLDETLLSGEHVQHATVSRDRQSDQYIVELQFDDEATRLWEDFTDAGIGSYTAFTLDSRVVSAPQIQEAIPYGRTQITGGFTEESAHELADALNRVSSASPVTFVSSAHEMLSPTALTVVSRIAVIAAGLGLAASLIGAAYLARRT